MFDDEHHLNTPADDQDGDESDETQYPEKQQGLAEKEDEPDDHGSNDL